MKITITITKDDVVTTKNGLHYQIELSNNVIINFTPDAAEEFVADVKGLKEKELP